MEVSKTVPHQMWLAGFLTFLNVLGLFYYWTFFTTSHLFPHCLPNLVTGDAMTRPDHNCPPCPAQGAPAVLCPACPAVSCPECSSVVCPECPAVPAARAELEVPDAAALKAEVNELRSKNERLKLENEHLTLENAALKRSTNAAGSDTSGLSAGAAESAKNLLWDCSKSTGASTVTGRDGEITSWKGYQCRATDADMERYFNYTPRELCPQDWFFVQKLIFSKDCLALPRRRCFTVTPPQPEEPMPFPASLLDQKALMNSNVRWDLHQCKSFECLNSRDRWADCVDCFNITLEARRYYKGWGGSLKIADVVKLKDGHLRIGIDIGGGSGTFAAHMARYNVTVMSTAWNVETTPNFQGLPFMETIAMRGLFGLHLPHQARLPLFDGTLDFIHAQSTIKHRRLIDFEEMLFEWDRVLRVGGIIWLDLFYSTVQKMPLYVGVLEMLGYKKLYWNHTPKPDQGFSEPPSIYLNCILEKPPRPGAEVLNGPPAEDSDFNGLFSWKASRY